MAVESIPVDLFNPGQVFACLGFLEAAEVLLGDAEGGFDWSDEADIRFMLRAGGAENPFDVVLSFLAAANVVSLAPKGSLNDTAKWHVPTKTLPSDAPFPTDDPPSPATLPAVLEAPTADVCPGNLAQIMIDHWGDSTQRDTVKFWGGSQGYPGAALLRDALDLVRENCRKVASDPFNLAAPQRSSFRFDWRRDYIPIDIGFSVNKLKGWIVTVGFPLVEVLAAVGLSHARPKKVNRLEYLYSVIGADNETLLPTFYLRAALGDSQLPFLTRTFRMCLGWPGKEGQARCITTVTEETSI